MSFGEDVAELVELARDPLIAKATAWPRVPLGEVADILNGFPWKSERFSKATGVPLIRIRDVTTGETETYYDGPLTEGYWVEQGDLLVGMDGDFNVRRWKAARGLLNQRVCKITVHPDQYDTRLLEYLLPGYLRLINQATSSVTVKHLSSRTLNELPLPLPPLAEQRRIVAKLDALTACLARALAELDRVPVLARHLREVALTSARAEAVSAPCVPVGGIATITFDGPFGSNLKSADYVDEGVRVVRLENIGHLSFIGDKETFISLEKYEGLKRHTLAPGDILFSSFVDREVRICLFPDNLGHVAINKADCFAVRPDLALCDPHYVTFLLASAETYEAMKENVRGVTRPRIGLSQLRNYEIPLPPVREQKRIADSIKATFARADRLEAEATRARALLDRLESALLAKAFRGELVPEDPNDEPAQTLLDRIRQQHAAAPKAKRGRKAKVAM